VGFRQVHSEFITKLPMTAFPESWTPWVNEEFAKPYWNSLVEFVDAERHSEMVFPESADTFNAFRLTSPQSIKIVILGQDPYPTPGNAHGISFSVRSGVKLPASLRNIYKELKADLGIPVSTNGNLTTWAKRGVLLLNTVLTVRSGEVGSHRGKGWETFTDAVISAISQQSERTVFILWGSDAQKKRPLIDESKHAVLISAHPSPLSAHRGFFGSKPFSLANAKLVEWGRGAVDWS
jgi:uracil-DNA glycosylase